MSPFWVSVIVLVCLLGRVVIQLSLRGARRHRDSISALSARNRALAAENARLLNMAEFDDLTAARSRRYLREMFARTRQDGNNAMIFVDLDEFKSVNDGFGHRAGDGFLRRIAEALHLECREGETLFRHGGDEFCIYLQQMDVAEAAARAAAFVRVVGETVVDFGGVRVRRTASAGVARIDPGQDMVGALYYADEALYAAKQAGGNTVKVVEGETLKSMIARRTGPRAEDLAEALRRDEITYFVQPIYDTARGRAVGVEVLIRWVRGDGDVLLPEKFIDMMHGSRHRELTPPVGASAEVAERLCPANEGLYCAFNVSSRFLERSIEDNLDYTRALTRDIDPSHVVFELVESAVIRNPGRTFELLQEIRNLGVRIALDDFGTGFSNLDRLQDYPVDMVKIDRRFVRGSRQGQGHHGILRALHDLSCDMGFTVIAEGVETREELSILQDIGISNVQGYLLGRPEKVEYWQSRIGAPLPSALCTRKPA